jgi:mannose-6-phosphate isomerase-like protein (cupin superfamily)
MPFTISPGVSHLDTDLEFRKEYSAERPWGSWLVIEQGPGYKVKRLIIKPKQSISNQYHLHRSETWCVVSGDGQAFIDNKIKVVHPGDTFTVKKKQTHRVQNISETEDLVVIEVQLGEICEEEDIVRVDEMKEWMNDPPVGKEIL